jgi:hypothetical protein
LGGKPRKETTRKTKYVNWVFKIKMDLVEVGWLRVDWIGLVLDRDSSFECGNEPSGSIKCWEIPDIIN